MRTPVKILISVLLTIILVYFLLQQISFASVISTLKEFPLPTLAFGFLLYVLSYLVRTLRFSILIMKKIRLAELFFIVCVHNMMTSLLPMRAGELSYVYLTGERGERKTRSLAAVLLVRLFDMSAIALIFIAAMTLTGLADTRFITLGAFAFAAVSAFFFVLFISYKNIAWLSKLQLMRTKPAQYILTRAEETLTYCVKEDKKKLFQLFLLSLLLWSISFSMSYFLVLPLGIDLGFGKTIAAFCFTALISAIPIQGVLGFGTVEAGWTIIFMYYGVEKGLAIPSGFSFHILNILFFLVLGIVGLFGLRAMRSKHKEI
ncbi:MAG: flippase-like domain-containing protein [Nanoarchaeota archaeon]|nr:flippase-like domain-containing protein [Nanoarchaeota archaeon]